MRRLWTVIAAVCLFWAGGQGGALARILYVDVNGWGGNGTSWSNAYDSIQDALNAAQHGDQVWVAEGTYYENLNVSRAIEMYGSFTGTESHPDERPTGEPTTIVDADVDEDPETEDGNGFNSYNPAVTVLDGFQFVNGTGTEHFNSDGEGNRAGGVYLYNFQGRIKNVIFENNATTGKGGGLYIQSNYNEEGAGPVTIENVVFRNNNAGQGGGLYIESIENEGRFDITFEDVIFDGNSAASAGGGLYVDITQWSDQPDGSGDTPGARLDFSWCEFTGNSAGAGGGAYLTRDAGPFKPLFYNDAEFYRATFDHNNAKYGGAIYVNVDASVSDSTFTGNQAYGNAESAAGGALYVTNYNWLSGSYLTLTENTSAGPGGAAALDNGGRLSLFRSTLSDNSASDGGAIHAGRDTGLQLTGSKLTGNTASGRGGAVSLRRSGSFYVVSNLITGNTAGTSGGGLYAERAPLTPWPDSPSYIKNNTISDNHAPAAGGVDLADHSTLDFYNNIVAFNDSGIRGDAGIAVRFYNNNVYGNGTKDVEGIASLVGRRSNTSVDPLFVNRAAGDYHLTTTSPLVDAGHIGTLSIWETDAGGSRRVQGNSVDVGAYEVAGPDAMLARFDTQPAQQAAPGLLESQPKVSIIGPTGDLLTSYNGPVTISLLPETGTHDATLGGTKTVNAVNGVATFTDLAINKPGLAYVLVAAVPSRGGTESRPFTITAPVMHVSPSGFDGADGATWTTAKRSLHLGLAGVAPGGAVWLAGGTYRGAFMAREAGILGGFAGWEPDAAMRNPKVNETILDGEEIDTTLNIQPSGAPLVFDGLTIRNGARSGVVNFADGVTLSNNIIGSNTDTVGGGGILSFGDNTRITRNWIRSNVAPYRGGGISIAGGTATIDNNLIDGNRAPRGSGVDTYSHGQVSIVNNTIVGGQGIDGAVYMAYGTVTLANNIIANNGSGVMADANFPPTVTLIRNILNNVPPPYKNLDPGPSDIRADPMFRAPGTSDYRSAPGSPAIDAGSTVEAVGTLDFLGKPRVVGGIVDIGAYEVQAGMDMVTRALKIAGGLQSAESEDMADLNVLKTGASQNVIDLLDALKLMRKVVEEG